MLGIPLILVIIIGIIAALIVLKIAKSLIKAIFTGILIIIILMAIASTIIYFDISTVKNSFEEEKIFVITENDEIISSAKIRDAKLEEALSSGLFEKTTDEEKKLAENLLKGNKIDSDTFILVADYNYIKPNDTIRIGFTEFSEAEIKETLHEEESEDLKTTITAILVINKIKTINIKELSEAIKQEEVKINPKLITTMLITTTPESIIKNVKLG